MTVARNPIAAVEPRKASDLTADPPCPVPQPSAVRGVGQMTRHRELQGRNGFLPLQLCDGWRLSEDGELQWIVQRLQGTRWRDVAWCGTKAGLLDVALPHHKVAAPAAVLAALRGLPEHYRPGALGRLMLAEVA